MMVLNGLTKNYDSKCAIRDFSLTIENDEYLTLLGPSGSGKSTLLRLIAGFENPDTGTIFLNGKNITNLQPHKRGLGIVQQNYSLFPHMSVFENIAFGLRYREDGPILDSAKVKKMVFEMLKLVGMEGFDTRGVNEISGGQKQRVSLARTLVTRPRLCLLDEPLGALDANLRERMTKELRRIRDSLGVTFMHVTGNENEALSMGDRMIVLDAGSSEMVAPPTEVFDSPKTVRVAKILSCYNILEGFVRNSIFEHETSRLPVPASSSEAKYYAVRFDAARIISAADPSLKMKAIFLASEFTGGGVTYLLRGPKDAFEVKTHLSMSDPKVFRSGEEVGVTWNISSVLTFDAEGNLIEKLPPLGEDK